MKKILFVLFVSVVSWANGQDKLFEKAVQEGYKSGGYQFEVPKNKFFKEDEIRNCAAKHNYEIVSIETRQQAAFGYPNQTAVNKVVFMDKDASSVLYFIAYNFNNSLTAKSFNSEGNVYIPGDYDWYPIRVKWSGSVSNGKVDGYGSGIANLNGKVYFVQGNYRNGLPIANTTVKTGDFNALKNNPKSYQSISVYVHNIDNQGIWIKKDGSYYYVRNDGGRIGGYESIVSQFNSDGKAVVILNSKENYINRQGVIGLTENQKKKDEEARIAEQKRQEEARIAEQRRQEEARIAEQKRREEEKKRQEERNRKIAENSNVNNWTLGDKLCNCQSAHVMVALESLNKTKHLFKGRIVASDVTTFAGKKFKKNDTVWFETTGWHKCLSDEVSYCMSHDDSDPTCGTMTDNDGNTYNTVRKGSVCWMAENMKSTKDRYGNKIDHRSNTDILAYKAKYEYPHCTYENGEKYGLLYSWKAAMKVCPEGWHLPTEEEVRSAVGMGIFSQKAGCYDAPLYELSSKLGEDCYLWTSSQTDSWYDNTVVAKYACNNSSVSFKTTYKYVLFSVRCFRD